MTEKPKKNHWYEMYELECLKTKELEKQNTNLQIMLQAEREVRCNEEYLKRVTELEAKNEELQEEVKEWEKASDKWKALYLDLEKQIEKMKTELHHRLVSPSHSDSDCLDKIIGLDRLWQFGQEF